MIPVTLDNDSSDRKEAHRAIAISALGLGLSGAIELCLAIFTHSVALLGDALHNLSDVSTSIVVFIGLRISKREPTEKYPYGYERAEDIAGLGIALVIWASAVFAATETYHKFIDHTPTTHVYVGMAGAVLGIVANQVVARYKLRVGTKIHSATLIADAKHSWLDAISSLGALLGLIMVAFGHPLGDPIAGIFVTLFIVHVGYEVTTEMIHHLMDGVDPEILAEVTSIAAKGENVISATSRARWTGRSLIVEIVMTFEAKVSFAAIQKTSRHIESEVVQKIPGTRMVTIVPKLDQNSAEGRQFE